MSCCTTSLRLIILELVPVVPLMFSLPPALQVLQFRIATHRRNPLPLCLQALILTAMFLTLQIHSGRWTIPGTSHQDPSSRFFVDGRYRHSISEYHSRHSSLGYDNIVGPSSAGVLQQIHNTYLPQPPMHSRYVQLFDSEYPERPHPELMMHLFQGFFDHYASQFTFLTHGETINRFWGRKLCPALSNCIAALAVW